MSTVSTVGDVNGRVGQALIHYLRGVDIANATYNPGATGGPVRDWIMGDVIHSKPLSIPYGDIYAWNEGDWDDESRNADISDQNIYVKVVFGANDGMFHFLENAAAHRTETGVED